MGVRQAFVPAHMRMEWVVVSMKVAVAIGAPVVGRDPLLACDPEVRAIFSYVMCRPDEGASFTTTPTER
jgi:hypothetical protein